HPARLPGSAAVRAGRQRRTLAAVLVLLGKGHAVPRRDLGGAARRPDVPALHVARLDAVVADIVPVRGIAGVLVDADPFHALRGHEFAVAAVEPEPIAFNRTANRGAAVVRIDDGRGSGNADAAERVVNVAAR